MKPTVPVCAVGFLQDREGVLDFGEMTLRWISPEFVNTNSLRRPDESENNELNKNGKTA